jgi:hypothetical protein
VCNELATHFSKKEIGKQGGVRASGGLETRKGMGGVVVCKICSRLWTLRLDTFLSLSLSLSLSMYIVSVLSVLLPYEFL